MANPVVVGSNEWRGSWMKGLVVSTIVAGAGLGTVGGAFAIQLETQAEKAANLQKQASDELFNQWNFDKPVTDEPLAGFVPLNIGEGPDATWHVLPDTSAPSLPNAIQAISTCPSSQCYRLLVAQGFEYEYPDLLVRIRAVSGQSRAVGGAVFGLKDARNFYAVVVDLPQKTIEIIRLVDGVEQVLSRGAIKPKAVSWHSLRIQRDTIISKDVIEAFFDGQSAVTVQDQTLGLGQVGLLVRGEASLQYDSFHAVPLYSQRPFSPPAAY